MDSILNGKRALVTGAGGFIGSHLTERLIDLGCEITALVQYNSTNGWGFLENLPKESKDAIQVVEGDLTDENCVREVVEGQDCVFHLGAIISIPYSYKHPRDTWQVNVVGTMNVLAAARDCTTSRILITSSSEVYGTARYTPIDEAHPLQGQSPYSASKIAADKMAEAFYCSYGLPVVTVRPFNTFGPRQSTRAVIPAIITQALTSSTLKLGDVTTTRDFTYVLDTVEGFVKAAEAQDVSGEVINLGTGNEVSIEEVVNRVGELLDTDLDIVQDPSRLRPKKSEVRQLISVPSIR
jgi:dTDP-glucose 4,6-dehydratase